MGPLKASGSFQPGRTAELGATAASGNVGVILVVPVILLSMGRLLRHRFGPKASWASSRAPKAGGTDQQVNGLKNQAKGTIQRGPGDLKVAAKQ